MTKTSHIGPLDGLALVALAFLVLLPSLIACGLASPLWALLWSSFPWPHLFIFLMVTLFRGLLLRIVPRAALSFWMPSTRWVVCLGILAVLGLLYWGAQGAFCTGTNGLFAAPSRSLPEFLYQPLIGPIMTPMVLIFAYVFWVMVTGRPLGPKRKGKAQ